MHTPIRIERIEIESLGTAFDLLRRSFDEEGFDAPDETMHSALATLLTSESSAVFVAFCGGQAQGVATVTTSVGIEYGHSAELEDLYVLPQARGKGIASGLIDAVCSWCREQSCATVLVTVTPEGETAHGLVDYYQRQGFVNTKRVILARSL
jgi:aminoglycoside 6'-N-acetyltransferase I